MKCTETEKQSQLDHYYRRMALYRKKLGDKCNKCGSTEDLHFDHIDPKTKDFDIGNHARRDLNLVLTELEKCQILCRPCHIEKNKLDNGEAQHGTRSMYGYHKCRCKACRDAHNTYCREYKKERRKKRRSQGL